MRSSPSHARARKRFGQHFLEPAWARKVVEAVAPTADHTVLEIGPGRGAITGLIAARARQVVAFEIDRDLAASLREAAVPNLRVVDGDFLDVTPDHLRRELAALGSPVGELRVAGNLPYNVASPILFKLVELFAAGLPIVDASVMLQREVANRLLAQAGTKDYGVLTVLIRHQADVERLLSLPAGAFRPAPRVQSTLVRLRFHPPDPPVGTPAVFSKLTQAIFTRRRKTIANALLAYPRMAGPRATELLDAAGIEARRRPETLTLEELARLADLVASSGAR